MSKKTIGLVVGLLILTVFLVALAMQSANQVPPPTQQAIVTPTPAIKAETRLFMTPDRVNLVGNRASVTINMNSQENEVTGVQMEISYDPKVLSFVSITPVSEFAGWIPIIDSRNIVDRKNGRISYSLGKPPRQPITGFSGESEVVTLVFTKVGSATASASTEIEFLPKSQVLEIGNSQSVLKEAVGTTVLLNN